MRVGTVREALTPRSLSTPERTRFVLLDLPSPTFLFCEWKLPLHELHVTSLSQLLTVKCSLQSRSCSRGNKFSLGVVRARVPLPWMAPCGFHISRVRSLRHASRSMSLGTAHAARSNSARVVHDTFLMRVETFSNSSLPNPCLAAIFRYGRSETSKFQYAFAT